MQVLASKIEEFLDRASWIRKMFETGAELKAKHGEDKVCDFSLGNPDLPPPAEVGEALSEIAADADRPFAFGYMPNPGYPFAREALAHSVTEEQGLRIDPEDLVVTCGAAGAINAVLRAVLEPGDEVLAPAPFFVEYVFYVDNHGGTFKPVLSKPGTFELDLDAIEKSVTSKTRAIIINSPNNPTGAVYSKGELTGLADILARKSEQFGRPIFLISDEPYRFLAYDGVEIPSVLPMYPYSIAVSSFSKSLSLAGERVGYAVAAPNMPDKDKLLSGLIFANRVLGFVNAPAVGQKLMAKAIHARVDVDVYRRRRDAMADILEDAGYRFTLPKGAFYFFPAAPGGDDVAFVEALQEQLILGVPGKGFGYPGYVRLSFCVGEDVIERSRDGFRRAMDKFRQ
jgi:aspartate aminotransferase